MVKRLIILLMFLLTSQEVLSGSFSDLETGGIWDGTINPILLPLNIEPENSYDLNMLFPGMERLKLRDRKFGIGFANNSFKDIFINLQSEKEKIGLGIRLFNLDYNSIVKNDQYDYSPDSSSYIYDNYKNENYSISLGGFLNSKKAYQTGISISAGIIRDSIINKYGEKIIYTGKSYYNGYSRSWYAKVLNYNINGNFLQRMRRCKKKTFFLLTGDVDNSIENINSYRANSDDQNIDSSFVKKHNYSYSVKPGILRFRDEKRLTGIFVGTEYFARNIKDSESELMNEVGLSFDDDYRNTYYCREFFLEGLYSRRLNFKNVTFSLGHDIMAAYSFSRSDSIGTLLHDSTFISLDYTIPLLVQFNIKDIFIIHSAYNMNLFVEYMLRYKIEGVLQERDDYEKAPECDFQFAATPLAFTLNLKDRVHFSFVPRFDYDGIFAYKAEMRYFPKNTKQRK